MMLRAQLALADELDVRPHRHERHLHVAAQHGRDRGRGPAKRHEDEFQSGPAVEFMRREIGSGAYAGRGVAHLVRLRLGVGDELLQRGGRHIAVHDQKKRHRPDRADRHEFGEGIVRHVPHQVGIDDDVAGVGNAG